jgi:hypothetical protein
MSQKAEKPTLTGHRIKTRKRDEKEKYDPSAFRDAVLQGLNEAGQDIELKSKFLDSAGSRLDYRRYAEPLLDVLFAGGILAPGGTILQDAGADKISVYNFCVFKAAEDLASLKAHYEVLYKLIRRYKYLEKSLDEELRKLLMFLKGFNETERRRLAQIVGICLSNSLGSPTCLLTLFEEHLVKDGLSIEFAQAMFKAWLQEKDIQSVAAALKKAGIEAKLLELLPINKRTQEHFESFFTAAGLEPIVDFQRIRASAEMKKGVQAKLEDMIHNEEPVKEMVVLVKEHMVKTKMLEHEVVVMVWNTLMNAVEWNKKEELVADQALKHLKQYATLLAAITESERSQLVLIVKMQEYCYDNMNFLKVFSRLVVLFYKADVLGEDAVLKWYQEAHSPKGKSVFLEQTKSFVQWLKNAEEESEEEAD